MRIRCCFYGLALMLLVALAASTAVAQVTGRITGSVTDPSGDVIPGADVSVTNEGTGETRTAQSGPAGGFVVTNLPPASYTVRISFEGFRAYEETGVILVADQNLALGPVALTIGSVTETITVEASGARVETDTSGVNSMLTSNQMEGLMQRGRDIVGLMTVLPGVSQTADSDALGGNWGTNTPNFQGARAQWNNFKLDGQTGNDVDATPTFQISVSMDAIQEVSIKQTAYQAEYGRVPGAQVNIISKSGTNEFHGSAYWFKRHEMFNANNFFNNRTGLEKPKSRFLTVGGVIGGPVIKDKLFFFYSREDWRINFPGVVYQSTVATALERMGDFSDTREQGVFENGQLVQEGALTPINDPLTRDPATGSVTPFPNNVVPASRINPSGRALVQFLPEANFFDRGTSLDNFNYLFQEVPEQPKEQNQFRIDWIPTANNRIFFRPRFWDADLQAQFSTVAFNAFNSSIFKQPHHYLYKNRQYQGSYTYTLSPTMINEFSFGWGQSREDGGLTDEFDLAGVRRANNNLDGLGQLFPDANPLGLVPQLSFGGVPSSPASAYDPRTPIDAGDDRGNLSNNFSWIKDKHTFKFGVYWEANYASEGPRAAQPGQHMGNFVFNRDGNNPGDTNHPFSNAVVGNFVSYSESSGRSAGESQRTIFEWYAQDTWKATNNLTLDIGVRFSAFTPYGLRFGEGSALLLEDYSLANAPLLFRPGLDQFGNRAAVDPRDGSTRPAPLIGAFIEGTGDRLNGVSIGGSRFGTGFRENSFGIGPRLGFAYDVFGNGKTAIRGGFGIVNQAMFGSQGSMWTITTSPPILESPSIFFGDMGSFLTGAGSALFPAGEVIAFDPNFPAPYVMQWNFGIQQDLGFGTVLDVSYVGNTGRHLYSRRNLNLLPPGTRTDPANVDSTTGGPLQDTFLRPFTGYEGLTYIENTGTSNYNSLQVSLNRRFAAGLQFGLAYTWSKAMGIAAGDRDFQPMFRGTKE